MSDITLWSTTAASNNAAPPNGFPEGMAPSAVDDGIREIMASVRRFVEDGGWFKWGHTTTYASGTSFTVTTDVTAIYHIGRRVRAIGTGTGTIYGSISNSVYAAGVTTVTVTWDSGSLSSETLAISVGYLNAGDPAYSSVSLTGNQAIAGVKTFSSFPVGPSSAPTTDYQMSNKKYVDDQISGYTPVQLIVSNVKTATYTMLASDKGKVIDCSNGPWTLTCLPLATAGSGYYVWVRNNGMATITLSADGAETIKFRTVNAGTVTIPIYPNQAVLIQAGATYWNVISGVNTEDDPGTVKMTGGSAAPVGWLLCDGTAYSRTTYAALFAALGGISSPWGLGNGSTTFNVPDLQQRFPIGKAASGTGSTLGGTGGSIDHSHTITGAGQTLGTYNQSSVGAAYAAGSPEQTVWPGITISSPTGTNNPPYIAINFIIKY